MEQLGVPKRIGGSGPIVGDLEWDVKKYLALNGGMHDAAIAAWNHKGVYDSARPISYIRYMGQLGQSTDPNLKVTLARIETMRRFAVDELKLPDNDSYTSYVALDRPYVVWNAKTAPRLVRVQDPVRALKDDVEELKVVNGYRVPAAAIARAAE